MTVFYFLFKIRKDLKRVVVNDSPVDCQSHEPIFHNKNILPGVCKSLPAGDKAVIMAMIEKEIELRSE